MRALAPLRLAAALLLLVAPAACIDSTSPPSYTDPTQITYAASLGVDLATMTRTTNGVYYRDISLGEGAEATSVSTVSVRYTGWLPNGTQFDSNVNGDPLTATLDDPNMLRGFAEGVTGMRVGGERLIVIPPQLGYGLVSIVDEDGDVIIPGNSVLVFRVTLLGVQ